jgi:hypothetical protein
MKRAIFVVSLDFELHWGGFEKWPLELYRQYFLNTRSVIPKMLSLFHHHEVRTTWATVGLLFHASNTSLNEHLPLVKPSYRLSELSAYNFMDKHGVGTAEDDDPFHYGATLIMQIINTPFQELASHTFAHYYCNEAGQTVEEFAADLRAAQQSAALLYGKKLKSLVFPRNQFNDDYLRVCYEQGFVAVRTNPRDWFWKIQGTQAEPYWKRFNRGLDAYVPIGKTNTFKLESLLYTPGLPVCIPASRLLRPYQKKEMFLNDLKIARIKSELSSAAMNGEVYHLWWHPHNFGHYPEENLEGLKQILNHFSLCRKRYGMESLSMGEVAELVINKGIAS